MAAERESYFPETGFSVRGAFLIFFEQHGGLDIFGYPRTPELDEGGRKVQYFQRARFEDWPENPERYRVQLMLIGDAVMGPAAPAISQASIPPAGELHRRYFPETGHTVAYAFLDFFDNHGGVDIFGFPTSEMAAKDGHLMQRFQRARFEWRPENPDPYEVQLGLLGDEYLAGLGKQKASVVRAAPAGAGASLQGKLAIMTAVGGDILIFNPDGSGLSRVTRGLDPAWSPDGRKLAVARWEDTPGVYVVDVETGRETLAYRIDEARLPAWSPDGAKLAFQDAYVGYRYARQGRNTLAIPDQRYRISVVNLSDGSATELPSELHSYSPAWAPDGKSVLYKGDRGLYLTDRDLGSRLVAGTDTRYLSPVWSPDGKRIAFVWKQHDHTEIAVINWDGTGFQNLTRTQDAGGKVSNSISPAWSPDGAKIAQL